MGCWSRASVVNYEFYCDVILNQSQLLLLSTANEVRVFVPAHRILSIPAFNLKLVMVRSSGPLCNTGSVAVCLNIQT